jgi:tetratricopeptide (TPR) repeat protein
MVEQSETVDATSEGDVDPVDNGALPFDTDPGADVIEAGSAAAAPIADRLGEDEDEFENAATQAYDRDALLKEAFGKARPAVGHPARAQSTQRQAVIVPPAPPVPVRPKAPPAPPPPTVARPPAVIAPPPVEVAEEEPEELAEAEFFIEQQLWDEAEEVIGSLRSRIQHYPHLHERLVALEHLLTAARDEGEPTKAQVPASESDEQFDLAAELEKEVAAEPAADSTDDFQYSVEDVLREFKKGVERTVRPEDVETHYDLGIAYREMGLLDEAVGEFDMAAKGAGGKPREADCLAMIGECLKDKGSLADAAAIFEKAIQVGGLRPETTLNLYFEIGVVREGLGDVARALEAFEKVAALDPKYRDVAERLARLKGARRKVGYL